MQPMKFDEDIRPLSEFRAGVASFVKQVTETGRPLVLTQRGRASAVLQSAGAYERTQRENEILRILARGDAEIAAGVGYDADDVMAEARELLASE